MGFVADAAMVMRAGASALRELTYLLMARVREKVRQGWLLLGQKKD